MDINKTHLKILQWNCRSVSNKLILHNEAKNFDIIVLIETWLNEIKHLKLKGFNIVRFDRQSGSGGGIAICIKQNIFYEGTTINFSSKSLETGSVIIKLHSEKLLITTCYRPEYIGDTLNNLTANTWNNLTKAVLDHGTEYFILCGDFNAHHPMWGSDKSCSNGLIIAENTDPEEFILLNDRSPTHYTLSYSGFSESCIDLFFCSSNIFYKSSWYVVDDSWKNDHYPIVLEINVKPIYQQRIYYRHNLKKLNWENFYDILEKNRALFTGLNCINQGIESRYKTFIEFLNEAITNSLPNVKNGIVESKIKLKTQNSKSTTKAKCIWWNEKCEKSFCNKITPKTRINEFWRTVKRFNNSLKELDSSSTNTKLENNMQEAIIKLCSPKSLTTDILINLDNMEVDTDNTPDCEVLNKLFSYEELHNPSTCEDQISQLEKENSKLLLHLKDRGLEVAPEKCVLVIFDKSKQAKKIPIKVNDLVVEPSEKTRFLGMIMDRQLNWNHHSTNLVNKCKYSLRILSFLRLTRWGANPEFLITLYKALIRPKMEYGCFLMFPSDMKIIDKLQKKLVLNNLETLTELSENFRFSHNYSPSLMMECYSKTWFLRDSIINSNKHIKYTNNFMHNFFKPNINLENGRKLLKCSSPQSLFIEMFPENNQNSIYIFTDGSKMSDNDNHSYVGMAAWSSTLDYCFSYKISDSASIFTAECSALIFTIDKIIEKRVGNYIIFSDSESALKALNSFSSESPLIYMIRHKLQLASQYNININLVWIPSHVGIQGNDNVDLLAKTAAKNGPFLDIPIPASDLVSGFKHECNEENEQVCLDLSNSKGSFYFDNFYTKKQKPWFAELGLSRKAIVSMNRIRCNHSSLNTSLFRKSIVHETTCVCGKNDDTIKHLFWECELHEEHRKTLLDNLKLSGINDPHTVIPLLASKNKNVIFSISKFLYDTKIKV
uniref:RNase H type-1 domain-containing protein n=1 Tax=Trichogramma kaykai TaxID=54128 RepID=A0ABD2WLB7_9HYME